MTTRPFIDADTPETRRILAMEIAGLFPESGIAGLYASKPILRLRGAVGLTIRCQVTQERRLVANFKSDVLLASMLTFCADQMERCRRRAKRRMAA